MAEKNPRFKISEQLGAPLLKRTINRPALEEMTAQQTYYILWQFRDNYLTEDERALAPEAKKERIAALNLASHNAALDNLILILDQAATAHAEGKIPAYTKIIAHMKPLESDAFTKAWETIQTAKDGKDPVAAKMAEALQIALYAVLPPRNNLNDFNNVTFRTIKTGGHGNNR